MACTIKGLINASMTTIVILGWKENFAGFTGWDNHSRSELKKRLRCGIKAPPAEIRRLARQISNRQPVQTFESRWKIATRRGCLKNVPTDEPVTKYAGVCFARTGLPRTAV